MIGLAPRQCGCNLPAGGGEWRADGGGGWGVKVWVGGIRNWGASYRSGAKVVDHSEMTTLFFNNDSTLSANYVCVVNFSCLK